MESIVGKILCDRYRITHELSHDNFSTVYLAEDLKAANNISAKCAIEILQPSYNNEVLGSQSWQKVLQEFATQGSLLKKISQHPQIPQLLASFECDRKFYLVRELIEGENLQQQLERKLLNEAQAIEWLQEILTVLEFIHHAEIGHYNIRPSSLVQNQNNKKFLTSFARIKNSILFEPTTIRDIASIDFSAPEQQEGKPALPSDIYALGKTIIYALTGQNSDFIHSSRSTASNDVSQLSYQTNPVITADIKPELADILNKMVEDNPSRRYHSAGEVLAELKFEPQNVFVFPPPLLTNYQRPVARKSQSKQKTKSSAKNKQRKVFKSLVWLFLTLPFLAALIIVFIGIQKNAYDSYIAYTNSNYQFSLKYPQDWLRRDLDDPITGEVVVLTSPLENNTDPFAEKVSIAVEFLPQKSTNLEEYSQTVIERVRQNKANNLEVYQERKTRINQAPARMIVYSRQEEGLLIRQMEVFTIKNDRVYIAIYTAERVKYSKFLETAEKIIDSWDIE